MSNSRVLQSFAAKFSKTHFDCDNEEHLDNFKEFLLSGRWGEGGCKYVLEYPYLSVPDMIKDKLVHKLLKIEKVTNESRY
jgi:hypothetical protein